VFYEVIKYDATSCPKVFHVVCLGLYFQYILSDFNQPDLKACSLKGNSTYAHIQNKLVTHLQTVPFRFKGLFLKVLFSFKGHSKEDCTA